MISVEGVVFDYPGLRALDHVSLAVAPQTITALVGPNGAGKTTLLRCIAALEAPVAGRITVDGLDVHEQPRESHRRLGYLSDFYGLYEELTVEQCLRYRAAAQGIEAPRIPALVARTADWLALSDRLRQKAGTLSRGLRQRLAIAQAVIHMPAVLLLDEPASGLDPEARQGLAAVLRDLRDGGMTIVVSSHILAELQDYSTHMLVIRDGRVIAHEAIAATPTDGRVLLAVRLAQAEPRLATLLAEETGASGIEVDGTAARFGFAADEAAQAALLRRLVEAGLPVASFAVERRNLQDAYLASVRAQGGAAA